MTDAIFGKEKQVRQANVDALKAEAKAALLAELGEGKFEDHDIAIVFEDLQYKAYRHSVLDKGVRADQRDATSIRPLTCEVGVLPRVHGSGLFQRGDTQAPGPHHARAHQGGAGTRRAHRRRQVQELHPPLQLPAVLHR